MSSCQAVKIDTFKWLWNRPTCWIWALKIFVSSSRFSFSMQVLSSSCWRNESCSSSEGSVSTLALASFSDFLRLSISLLSFPLSIDWVFSTALSLSLSSLFSFCCRGRYTHAVHVIRQLPMTLSFSSKSSYGKFPSEQLSNADTTRHQDSHGTYLLVYLVLQLHNLVLHANVELLEVLHRTGLHFQFL